MNSKDLYKQILRIECPWEVRDVELSIENEEIYIKVDYVPELLIIRNNELNNLLRIPLGQEIIFVARGFKGYENLRTSVLFFFGVLSLYP